MALVSDEKTPKDYPEAMALADKMKRQRDQLLDVLETILGDHETEMIEGRGGILSRELEQQARAAVKATEESEHPAQSAGLARQKWLWMAAALESVRNQLVMAETVDSCLAHLDRKAAKLRQQAEGRE